MGTPPLSELTRDELSPQELAARDREGKRQLLEKLHKRELAEMKQLEDVLPGLRVVEMRPNGKLRPGKPIAERKEVTLEELATSPKAADKVEKHGEEVLAAEVKDADKAAAEIAAKLSGANTTGIRDSAQELATAAAGNDLREEERLAVSTQASATTGETLVDDKVIPLTRKAEVVGKVEEALSKLGVAAEGGSAETVQYEAEELQAVTEVVNDADNATTRLMDGMQWSRAVQHRAMTAIDRLFNHMRSPLARAPLLANDLVAVANAAAKEMNKEPGTSVTPDLLLSRTMEAVENGTKSKEADQFLKELLTHPKMRAQRADLIRQIEALMSDEAHEQYQMQRAA
jgi:uncharacterized protein YqgV (UPF0045/DUF77 family)